MLLLLLQFKKAGVSVSGNYLIWVMLTSSADTAVRRVDVLILVRILRSRLGWYWEGWLDRSIDAEDLEALNLCNMAFQCSDTLSSLQILSVC